MRAKLLKPYQEIFSYPGSLAFSLAGLITRMPMSMTGLAIILLIYAKTGSYGTAGAVVAAYSIAQSFVGPRWARMADRIGQSNTIRRALPFHIAGLLLIVILVSVNTPSGFWYFSALLAATFSVQTGSLIRRRWHYIMIGKATDEKSLARGKGLLNSAWSLEALVDEVVFVVGPIVATVLCTQVAPTAGLLAGISFVTIGSLFLLAQGESAPPTMAELGEKHSGGVWKIPACLNVTSVNFFLGAYFGAVELAVVAICTEAGAKPLSGVLLAVWAFGSGVAAIANGIFAARFHPAPRFLISLVSLTLLSIGPLLTHSLFTLGIALFFSGFAISPVLIAGISVVEKLVPETQMTEAIAIVTMGFPIGSSAGVFISGQFLDRHTAHLGLWLPLGFLATAVLISLLRFASWRTILQASRL